MKIKIFIFVFLLFICACKNNSKSKAKLVPLQSTEKQNNMIYIKKGSFVNTPLEIHLEGFFISSHMISYNEYYKLSTKSVSYDLDKSFEAINNLSYYDIAQFCNQKSLIENLSPYYYFKGNKIYENVNNNGYRLPIKEEFIYLFDYNINSLYTTHIEKSKLFFDTIPYFNLSINLFPDFRGNELCNNDLIQNQKKSYNGFRIARNSDYPNTNGLRYTTREIYKFPETYEYYNVDKYGISFPYPKDWGTKYIYKNLSIHFSQTDLEKYEKGIPTRGNGVVFYKEIYNTDRLYSQNFFIYNKVNLKLKKYNRKTKKYEIKDNLSILDSFSKKFNLNSDNYKILRKNDAVYIFSKNTNLYKVNFYIIKNNIVFLLSFETINSKTKIPLELIDFVFNNIDFY